MKTENTKKVALTTIDDVKKALSASNYKNNFVVTSTEQSINNSYCFINLINENKQASSQTCFIIGFDRLNYRFSSNSKFENCDFLKEVKRNSKNRYEVTIKRDDIVNVINQACDDYCKRNKIVVQKTTASKKSDTSKKAVNK